MSPRLWHMGLAVSLLGISSAQATIRYDVNNPAQAATVNQSVISSTVLEVMYAVSVAKRPDLSRATVLNALIENHLLGQYAVKRLGENALIENTKVSFKPKVVAEQEFRVIMQIAFAKQLDDARKQLGGTLDSTISQENPIKPTEWDSYLANKNTLQLEVKFSPTGEVAASKRVLLAYHFDKNHKGVITLLDVYNSQNVQGRNSINNRDTDFVRQQARELVVNRFIDFWVQTSSGLSVADVTAIKQAILNKNYHDGFASYIGIAADIHDDVAYLKALAAKVSATEIKHYYHQHKSEFKRIERVNARHITVSDEKTAQQVAEQLKKGGDFGKLAQQYSIAADKTSGGQLGWIIHDLKNPTWLSTLAFVQTPNVPSRPVRTPTGQWEILLISNKEEGYQPVNSDSVRYVASQIIARQKAAAEYQKIRLDLLKQADIHINNRYQGQSNSLEKEVDIAKPSEEDHHHH